MNKNVWKKIILATSIVASAIILIISLSFSSALIEKIIEVSEEVDHYAESTMTINGEEIDTFWEKMKFYLEIRNQKKWNEEKYSEPLWNEVKKHMSEKYDNYDSEILLRVYHTNDKYSRLDTACIADISVDGNVAHGTMKIEIFNEINKENGSVLYQNPKEYDFEFYREFNNGDVTTFILGKDGLWYKHTMSDIFNNNVLVDVEDMLNTFSQCEQIGYPTKLHDIETKEELFSMNVRLKNNVLVDSIERPSYEVEYNEALVYFNRNEYVPQMIGISTRDIDENELKNSFAYIQDELFKYLCENCDLEIANVIRFKSFGKSKVILPKELEDAKEIDDFSSVFEDAIYQTMNPIIIDGE